MVSHRTLLKCGALLMLKAFFSGPAPLDQGLSHNRCPVNCCLQPHTAAKLALWSRGQLCHIAYHQPQSQGCSFTGTRKRNKIGHSSVQKKAQSYEYPLRHHAENVQRKCDRFHGLENHQKLVTRINRTKRILISSRYTILSPTRGGVYQILSTVQSQRDVD